MNDFREYNNYLMHYGIPGQRYGIRRYQNEDGTLTQEGKRRYLANANRNSNYGDTKGVDYFQGQKGFNARDTVATPTPAFCATSLIVAIISYPFMRIF